MKARRLETAVVLRSASFRLAAQYAALFAAMTVLLLVAGGGAVSWHSRLANERAIEAGLDDARAALEGVDAEEATRWLAAREAEGGREGFAFRLAPNDAAAIATIGKASTADGPWLWIWIDGEERDEPMLARLAPIDGLGVVLVGNDMNDVYELFEFLWIGGSWTLLAAMPASLISSWLLARRTLARIASIATVAAKARAEGFDARAPLEGFDDEFDQLASEINAMLDGLGRLARQADEVSVAVAHDLRTPLTRMRARLERMAEREEEGGDAETALAELEGVLGSFDALLRIAAIDGGARKAALAPVDLGAMMEDLHESYEPVAEASGRALRLTLRGGLGVVADGALLTQAIANLLDNAIEHARGATRIELGAAAAPGGAPLLWVADDGPGAPEDERPRLTERFYRIDKTRGDGGAGLGLALVASIAELHGAELSIADNAPGLRVEMRFPAAASKKNAALRASA